MALTLVFHGVPTRDCQQRKGTIMQNLVHASQVPNHRGVMRLENADAALRATAGRLFNAKTLAGPLVAAALAASVIVAEQIINTWADGQLLLAWLALWFMLFAAFALFSEAVFGWSEMLGAAIGHWSDKGAQQAADAQVWQVARTDHRVMADLRAAAHWPF